MMDRTRQLAAVVLVVAAFTGVRAAPGGTATPPALPPQPAMPENLGELPRDAVAPPASAGRQRERAPRSVEDRSYVAWQRQRRWSHFEPKADVFPYPSEAEILASRARTHLDPDRRRLKLLEDRIERWRQEEQRGVAAPDKRAQPRGAGSPQASPQGPGRRTDSTGLDAGTLPPLAKVLGETAE